MPELELDLLPDPVVVVDRIRRPTDWNQAAVDSFGPFEGSRAIGDAFDIRDLAGSATFRDDWPSEAEPVEWTVCGADGCDLTMSVTTRLLGEALDPDGAVLIARPIGEADGLAIVTAVSHELRSPLTSIKGYTSLLLSRWATMTDDHKREMLEAVHHDAGRVSRLVTELLDVSRIETGRLVLQRSLVDLRAIAAVVIDRVRLVHHDLECAVEFEEPFPSVFADPDKVEQVLTNLLENAAKYADPQGIRVVGRVCPDHVEVEVQDQGDGIASDDLPRVFTKFFRGEQGRPSGSGLGLWISRGLAEAHGGTLDARSQAGSGSEFRFSLPRDERESTGPSRAT
jgi:signal transduction histidine kinase